LVLEDFVKLNVDCVLLELDFRRGFFQANNAFNILLKEFKSAFAIQRYIIARTQADRPTAMTPG
jgi:hypothetical protein